MDRRDHDAATRGLHGAATFLGDAKSLAHDRLRGRGAEADDDLRLDEANFLLEPGMARSDLGVVRLLVDATRALLAPLPLEVLHGIRDVHVAALDPRFLEGAIEQLPRRTDERVASAILLVARLLADDHHAGILRSLAKDWLRSERPDTTATAGHRRVAQLR